MLYSLSTDNSLLISFDSKKQLSSTPNTQFLLCKNQQGVQTPSGAGRLLLPDSNIESRFDRHGKFYDITVFNNIDTQRP